MKQQNKSIEDVVKEFNVIIDHIFVCVQTPVGDFVRGKEKIKKHIIPFITSLVQQSKEEERERNWL